MASEKATAARGDTAGLWCHDTVEEKCVDQRD